MDIAARYADVMIELKSGARALQRYTPAEIQTLNQALVDQSQDLSTLLCLIAHSAYPDRAFEKPLLVILQRSDLKPTELVYALSAARKHIIQARFKEGQRLDMNFLELLRLLLRHSDLDVVEWALRTLEESGSQAVLLADDVRRIRPSVFSLWRAQSRTILELVTLLQRRWELPSDPQERRNTP